MKPNLEKITNSEFYKKTKKVIQAIDRSEQRYGPLVGIPVAFAGIMTIYLMTNLARCSYNRVQDWSNKSGKQYVMGTYEYSLSRKYTKVMEKHSIPFGYGYILAEAGASPNIVVKAFQQGIDPVKLVDYKNEHYSNAFSENIAWDIAFQRYSNQLDSTNK